MIVGNDGGFSMSSRRCKNSKRVVSLPVEEDDYK
jgi:hypothetical protein